MPRYEARWVEIAEKQRECLPADTRRLVNERIKELLENPTSTPGAVYYDPPLDRWSVPVGASVGLIIYAVRHEPRRVVILLRLIV